MKKDPATPLLGIYPKKPKTLNWKNIHIHMLTAALFTIAKIRKQPKCPSIDEWIKKWYIHTMKYDSAINKEWNLAICNNMDGPRGYDAEWNKSDRERQMPDNSLICAI